MIITLTRRPLLIGVLIVMVFGLSVYLRLWTIDYQISSTETELLRRQFDLANREAVDESAEWRLRFDEAEERASKCAKELKRVKGNLGDHSVTQRLDMLQKENKNLLERVESLKQELEAEKLKCSMQKIRLKEFVCCAAMTTGTSIQNATNLAFEAIARREAHELQLQQKNKNNKRFLENNRVEGSANLNQGFAPSTNAASTPSKKGKYSFTGQTAPRDVEPDHPIYLPLSHPVHEKLAMPNVEVNVMDKMLHELLQSGDSSQNYAQGSRKMKNDNRVHLDNKVQEHKMELTKVLQSHSKRSKKHMSMKQHKKIGSLDLPQDLHKFELFQPMHDMWKDYMTQLLKSVGKSPMVQCILGADLHGAHILVVECKMAACKGVSGIMIRETAETFGIITKDNKFKVVLKKISVFMLQVDCWKITLHGDKLTSRKVGQ